MDNSPRALKDFVALADLFDRHGVAFVSMTQQFDTATAMGRLILNILLAFAQFERENGAERRSATTPALMRHRCSLH